MRLVYWFRRKRIAFIEWRIGNIEERKRRFDEWFEWRIDSFRKRLERIKKRGVR